IAADINPRLRGSANLLYRSPFRVHAQLDLDASLELGDGRPLGPDLNGDYFGAGARQYAARVSVGYAVAPWAGVDLGMRYQHLEGAGVASGNRPGRAAGDERFGSDRPRRQIRLGVKANRHEDRRVDRASKRQVELGPASVALDVHFWNGGPGMGDGLPPGGAE